MSGKYLDETGLAHLWNKIKDLQSSSGSLGGGIQFVDEYPIDGVNGSCVVINKGEIQYILEGDGTIEGTNIVYPTNGIIETSGLSSTLKIGDLSYNLNKGINKTTVPLKNINSNISSRVINNDDIKYAKIYNLITKDITNCANFCCGSGNGEYKLLGLELHGNDFSNVTDMSFAFGENKITDYNFLYDVDFKNCTNISNMFSHNENLTEFPPTLYMNTSKVVDASYLFYGCASITSNAQINNLLSHFDTSSWEVINYMFSNFGNTITGDIRIVGFPKLKSATSIFGTNPNITSIYFESPTDVMDELTSFCYAYDSSFKLTSLTIKLPNAHPTKVNGFLNDISNAFNDKLQLKYLTIDCDTSNITQINNDLFSYNFQKSDIRYINWPQLGEIPLGFTIQLYLCENWCKNDNGTVNDTYKQYVKNTFSYDRASNGLPVAYINGGPPWDAAGFTQEDFAELTSLGYSYADI